MNEPRDLRKPYIEDFLFLLERAKESYVEYQNTGDLAYVSAIKFYNRKALELLQSETDELFILQPTQEQINEVCNAKGVGRILAKHALATNACIVSAAIESLRNYR